MPRLRKAIFFACWSVATAWCAYGGFGDAPTGDAVTGDSSVVDITFSVECRELESNAWQQIDLPWNDAINIVESMQAQSGAPMVAQVSNARYRAWWASTGLARYSTGRRLAFYHGLPDHSSYSVDNLRVVEATQERIEMRGTGDLGREEGYLDRRTGAGMVTWYGKNRDGPDDHEVVFKQFIFDCSETKPFLSCQNDAFSQERRRPHRATPVASPSLSTAGAYCKQFVAPGIF